MMKRHIAIGLTGLALAAPVMAGGTGGGSMLGNGEHGGVSR